MNRVQSKILNIIFLIILFQFLPCGAESFPNQQTAVELQDKFFDKNAQLGIGESQRYIDIKKELIPKKSIYLLNDNISLFVEIRMLKFSNTQEKIEFASIHELIDKNLNITNRSNISYAIYNISDANNLKYNFNFNNSSVTHYDINWDENYATFNVTKLDPWVRIIYWYNITPKKTGVSQTDTVVRSKYFSDINQELDFDVGASGLYDVKIITPKSNVIQNEKLNVTLGITYLGNGQDNAIIKLENQSGMPFKYLHKSGNMSVTNHLFSKSETFLLNVTIKYPKTGNYRLPGIWIGESYYSEERMILVESFFEKYWEFLQLLIIIGSIFSGILLFIKSSIEMKNVKQGEMYELGIKHIILKMISDIVKIIVGIPSWIILIGSTFLVATIIAFIILPLYSDNYIKLDILIIDNWIYLVSLFLIVLILSIGYILYLNLKNKKEKELNVLMIIAMIVLSCWLAFFYFINGQYLNQ